jgi:hypothetical protein
MPRKALTRINSSGEVREFLKITYGDLSGRGTGYECRLLDWVEEMASNGAHSTATNCNSDAREHARDQAKGWENMSEF